MLRNLLLRLSKLLLWLIALSVLLVLLLRWVPPPFTALMIERKIESWRTGEAIDLTREWRPWRELPDDLKMAVIAAEDQKFADHWGFDVAAIRAALSHNERGGSLRGASTLSQQVAKNLFLLVRAQLAAQGTGGLVHRADRIAVAQATHSRGLPQQRRMGRRHLRCAGGGAASFRYRRALSVGPPGQPAGRGAAQPATMERW